ncbi:unnamed protein product [Phytophthora lilii]|uniref:Unnamed protein product n=1 Tax=Phytophthora lilii TaxID=2077276 RepID=A0A9W6UBC9_9STRA|nr:unnamed protein product [Phytophthora lilii]
MLVDRFVTSGDFWGFVLEVDADYRRFMRKIAEEEEDAHTFMTTVLRQRKIDEDQMMQEWFTASAMQHPIINSVGQVNKAYSSDECNSSGSSVSQAILQSALVEDLVALSPNKKKDEVLHPEFPPNVIRQAMTKGFLLDDVIAVMRGLQAQRKDIEDVELVLITLEKRLPLMTNPWTTERALRESKSLTSQPNMFIPSPMPDHKSFQKPSGATKVSISENLLTSIPGGMKAPIARVLLVAALRCFHPGSIGEKGTFVWNEHNSLNLFDAYLHAESALVKVALLPHKVLAICELKKV